jgi:hypothetical protein
MFDGLDVYEASVMIPLNPMEPWMSSAVSLTPPSSRWHTSHSPLLCESRLTATAAMLITPFPIQIQENPVWKQRLEAVSDIKGLHFNVDMAAMAKYVQYLFNLQHKTTRTIMQQSMRLTTYDEHNTAISRELE